MNLEEYIRQESLNREQVQSQLETSSPRRLDVNMIWNIMRDITDGVAFIHIHMEVHRDIKPTNGRLSHSFSEF